MALVSGGRSTLNPDAPLFIPAAFRQVEDFSPEWWQLITTSTWYKDYWLSQHQGADGFYDNTEDDFDSSRSSDLADLLPDTFDLDAGEYFSMESQFDEFVQYHEAEAVDQSFIAPATDGLKMISNGRENYLRSLEGKSPKPQAAKYAEKAANFMNPKYSPRRIIQQPR